MDLQSEKVAQRGKIVGMKEAGLSADEIAAELGLHRATVYRWLRRWEEDGELRDRPRYAEQNIYQEPGSGHVTCNVWGWIGLNGVGEVTQIQGKFNADQYLEILEEVVLPSVRCYAIPYPENIVFMQDNCPVHTARVVRRWFEEQPQLELLPWPSNSPDLNPIENVWANITNVWEPTQERSLQQLMRHMETKWEVLRRKPQLIYNMVASVPDRLQSVVNNNGDWTRF
ncbi:hypothetical protein Pcinc_000122 [Petrolisthes cinctipes]|uniref:Tc1-like transposase DDE domain-containing protein n=1 Tax=Petrolisthes cinctipes TaxID=88211 RepID=A0AAE1L6N0_PETCI|nr:hypothetical protein Pcinc_000122 [Petrolisthes cinctipes]